LTHFLTYPQLYRSLLGKLARIAQQVEQRLTEFGLWSLELGIFENLRCGPRRNCPDLSFVRLTRFLAHAPIGSGLLAMSAFMPSPIVLAMRKRTSDSRFSRVLAPFCMMRTT